MEYETAAAKERDKGSPPSLSSAPLCPLRSACRIDMRAGHNRAASKCCSGRAAGAPVRSKISIQRSKIATHLHNRRPVIGDELAGLEANLQNREIKITNAGWGSEIKDQRSKIAPCPTARSRRVGTSRRGRRRDQRRGEDREWSAVTRGISD